MMDERWAYPPMDLIEQLAHGKCQWGHTTEPEFMEQRRGMMQRWADYLDKLRIGADVIGSKRL